MEENKTNTIGKEFTMKELIKFVAPPVLSKLFMSLLSTIDDSLFISRYCGQNALAAFTISLPWFMLTDAVIMIICAVSSKCSMLMGEKKNEEANRSFSTMTIVAIAIGLIFSLIVSLFKEPILRFLGATDIIYPYISTYINIQRFYIPLVLLSNLFARFYTVAGKPKIGVYASIIQITCNLFFDWLLIAKLGIGIAGAAYGNLAGFSLLTILGLVFFSNKNNEIHFAKPLENPSSLFKIVWKLGRSQGLNSLAVSVNCYIINYVLLYSGGETLVAGFTIVNNVQFMFMSAFFGLIASISPIVSYAFGEKNKIKLVKIIKKAVILIESLSVIVAIFIFIAKNPIIYLYFGEGGEQILKDMASYGLTIVPFCYGIFSFNVMVQDFLIAVGNHRVSALLSIIENIIFANLIVIMLPTLFGVDAIWYTFLVQEALTLVFTLIIVYKNADVYGYGKSGIATAIDN